MASPSASISMDIQDGYNKYDNPKDRELNSEVWDDMQRITKNDKTKSHFFELQALYSL